MDFPVLLLKFRDYLLWLGPLYLLALALDSATIICVRRLLRLPIPPEPPERKKGKPRRASVSLGIASALDSNALVLQIAWHIAGRPQGAWRVSTRLYIWSALMSRSISWTGLLLASSVGWYFSIMRVGFSLLAASLLSLFAPILIARGGMNGVIIVPSISFTDEPENSDSRPGILREWWEFVQIRFTATGDVLLLGAGFGAAYIAISPSVTIFIGSTLVAPISQLIGTVVGLLLPLFPGAEIPLVVAMQSRGIEIGALSALLLAATISSWRLAQDLYHQFGLRTALSYTVVAGLIVFLLAFPAGELFKLIGAL